MSVSRDVLPNLFIPGAQKSGTTSLAALLERHPDIRLGITKELNVFGQNDEDRRWGLFVKSFADRPARRRCDASVIYLYTPRAAARIAETVGDDARFVFLFRDPVDRAVSAYWHMVSHQQDDRPPREVFDLHGSFEEVVAAEAAAARKALDAGRIRHDADSKRFPEPLNLFRYLWGSCYALHLAPYLERFDRRQCLFAYFEELKSDPRGLLNRVLEFLELPPMPPLPPGEAEARNVTYVPQRSLMARLVRHARGLVPAGLRNVLRARLHGLYSTWAYERPESLDDDLRARLSGLFQPELERLAAMTGRAIPEGWRRTVAPRGVA